MVHRSAHFTLFDCAAIFHLRSGIKDDRFAFLQAAQHLRLSAVVSPNLQLTQFGLSAGNHKDRPFTLLAKQRR